MVANSRFGIWGVLTAEWDQKEEKLDIFEKCAIETVYYVAWDFSHHIYRRR